MNQNRKKTCWLVIILLLELAIAGFCLCGLMQKQQNWSFHGSDFILSAGNIDKNGNYIIDEKSGVSSQEVLSTGPLKLSKGVYHVKISFQADQEQLTEVKASDTGYHGLLQNAVTLRDKTMQKETDYRFMLLQNSKKLEVTVTYTGQGSLTVSEITVTHTNQEYSMLLCMFLLFAIPIDVLLFRRWTGKKMKISGRQAIFGICVIAFLASYPIFIDYMHLGDDVYFHMNRIEGLVREWQAGHFPARMQFFWLYGMGYPVSIMYGDLFLWIPAFFRFCGFDLAVSYKLWLVIWNIITAAICYFSFRGIFRSRYVGLFGSALYTLSLYRLYNIYVRVAIGEYTAMTFLPLACWGLAELLSEDKDKIGRRKNVWILALAYTGMLFSHILTLEAAVVFGGIVCLIYFRRFFRKETLAVLLKSILLALGLSMWFLVPFLDYTMHMDMQVFHVKRPIQKFGLYLVQLFWSFPWMGNEPSMYKTGMQNVRPFGIGLGFLAGTAVFLYAAALYRKKYPDKRSWKMGLAASGIALFSCWMCLNIFPWDGISSISESLRQVVYSLQFPYRMLFVVTISMTIVCCAMAAVLMRYNKKRLYLFTGAIIMMTMMSSVFFVNNETQTRVWSDLRDASCMGADVLGGKEYLLYGTDMNKLNYTVEKCGKNVICQNYMKEDDTIQMQCSNTGKTESYVDVTFLNYTGFHAWDTKTKSPVQIRNGTENLIRVVIPAGYSGNITVAFTGEWYWKAADLVTLLTLLLSAIYQIYRHSKYAGKYIKREKQRLKSAETELL